MTIGKEVLQHYDDTASFQNGLQVRTAVLGDEHVERSLQSGVNRDDKALQQLVTEFAWGTVWTRPTLGRRERSLATVSMLVALNRPHELAGHIRGALNNGVTVDELREVMVHSAVYCGFPAAIDASRTLAQVLDQMGLSGA